MYKRKSCECFKTYYIIWILSPIYIIAIIFNFLSIFITPFDRKEYKDLKLSLKKPPIISFSFDHNYFNQLKGKINESNIKGLHKALIVKRLNEKYNYKYLLREGVNKPGFHQCGKDGKGNYLFLPIDVECPINEFIISFSPDLNSFKDEYNYYNYTTILFYDGIYLHYSNENIYSTILTDIDFELVGIQNSYYTPYKKINITSDRIIEENYSLYLIMKH